MKGVTVTDKHVRQDGAIKLRRQIIRAFEQCSDPFVCTACRHKINMLINALATWGLPRRRSIRFIEQSRGKTTA
jgi:hypothetical protein